MDLPPAFTITTRRMTLLERWQARPAAQFDSPFGAFEPVFKGLYIIGGLTFIAFVAEIVASLLPRHAVEVWLATGGLVVLVLGYLVYRSRQEVNEWDDVFAADRRACVVEVHTLPLAAAVRLTTDDEEAPGWPMFLVQCTDGRRVYLEGEYLSEPVKDAGFPRQTLELIRMPRARRMLLARSQGAPVPSTTIVIRHWRSTPGDYTEVKRTDAALGEANRWLDGPHMVTATAAADDRIPLHPLIRPLRRYHIGYIAISCFIGAIGVVPPVIIIRTMLPEAGVSVDDTMRLGDIAMKVFNGLGVLLFPAFAFFMVRFILRGGGKMRKVLRQASRLLYTATPVRTRVTFTYHLQVAGESIEKSYRVRLTDQVPRVPAEFEIFPPLGKLKPAIGKFDWAHTGKKGSFSQIFLHEEADVYADKDGLAVIPTSKGVLIREMKMDD